MTSQYVNRLFFPPPLLVHFLVIVAAFAAALVGALVLRGGGAGRRHAAADGRDGRDGAAAALAPLSLALLAFALRLAFLALLGRGRRRRRRCSRRLLGGRLRAHFTCVEEARQHLRLGHLQQLLVVSPLGPTTRLYQPTHRAVGQTGDWNAANDAQRQSGREGVGGWRCGHCCSLIRRRHRWRRVTQLGAGTKGSFLLRALRATRAWRFAAGFATLAAVALPREQAAQRVVLLFVLNTKYSFVNNLKDMKVELFKMLYNLEDRLVQKC